MDGYQVVEMLPGRIKILLEHHLIIIAQLVGQILIKVGAKACGVASQVACGFAVRLGL